MSKEILGSRLEGTKLIVETTDGDKVYDSKFLVAALLVFVARGSGKIEPEESAQMIELIEEHFHMQGAESLELITYAMAEMAEMPTLGNLLADLGPTLSEGYDIALDFNAHTFEVIGPQLTLTLMGGPANMSEKVKIWLYLRS